MLPTEEAILYLNSQDVPRISEAARKFGVNRSTLDKKFCRQSGSKSQAAQQKQFLSIRQEKTLIKHINRFCERGFPPTPYMVANIAGQIAKRQPGKNWTSRFVKRWSTELDSKYLNTLDISRHKAESVSAFKQYFDILSSKIEQYAIQPQNMYNMDEKGFLIGYLTKSKRIFTKALFESGKLLGTAQDGNRKWVTVVATICADGTSLSPGLIYKGQLNTIQDTWLEGVNEEEHFAFLTSSANGWTNDELGFDWLVNLFDQETRVKAKRDWRLLFLDGHGSHLTIQFLDWCQSNKILVAVYPPHSTHRLQPLDVSLFAPLATFYSQGLDEHVRLSEGLTGVTKRDFLGLFWPTWQQAFTEANINSGWSKTGLCPFDPSVVLRIFTEATTPPNELAEEPHTPDSRRSGSKSSSLTPRDWRKIQSIVNKTVMKVTDRKHRKSLEYLGDKVISQSAEITVLREGNKRLTQALQEEQKRKTRGKKLMEDFRTRDEGNATFFSPCKVKQLQELQQARQDEKVVQQQEKADKAQEREQAKRVRAQAVAERKVERQKKAEEKKAALAARIASKAAARLARAAAHRPKVLNNRLHRNSKSKNKHLQRPREVQDDRDVTVVKSRLSCPGVNMSSSGRLIKPSKKLQQ